MYVEEQASPTQTDRPICGLPVDTDVLFSDKNGVYKKSIEKKKTKLLQKITFIRKFLDEDERIMFVTTGLSPFSAFEQLTTPWVLFFLMKRALFVFTNKRIFHVPTTTEYRYRGSLAHILYQDCNRLYVTGSKLVIEYRTGKKEKFYYMPTADRAKIKQMQIETAESGPPSARPERNHLCPSCTQELTPDLYTCPSCGLEFKSKAKAFRYSLLLPGGGYLYTRCWVMGLLDALAESYLLVLTLVGLGGFLLGNIGLLPVFTVFGTILALEKLVTVFHTYRFIAEFIPKDLKPLLASQTGQIQPPRSQPRNEREAPEQILAVR